MTSRLTHRAGRIAAPAISMNLTKRDSGHHPAGQVDSQTAEVFYLVYSIGGVLSGGLR
jgi:hypothetical protein